MEENTLPARQFYWMSITLASRPNLFEIQHSENLLYLKPESILQPAKMPGIAFGSLAGLGSLQR